MNRRIAVIASILLALLALSGAFYSNAAGAARWWERPHACDWFIFLRQARLFQEQGPVGGLDTDLRDANTRYLVEKVRGLGLPLSQWEHGVGPHCHVYKPRTDRVVIVSPPGTGLVLSLFPEGRQPRLAFMACSALILLGLAATILRTRRATVPLIAGALGLFCFIGLYRFVFDWSIPPSVALAALAGWLAVESLTGRTAARRWLAALALGGALGAAASVRVANILLLAGPGLALGLAWLRAPTVKSLLAPVLLTAGALIGALPFFAANAINAGHPLLSTYGPGNTEALQLDWPTLRGGLDFYFRERMTSGVFVAIAAAATLALFVLRRRLRLEAAGKIALAAAVSLAVSMLFLLLYRIHQHYYPFPMAVFVLSTVAFALIRSEQRHPEQVEPVPLVFRVAGGAAVLAVVAAIFRFIALPVSPDYARPDIDFRLPERAVLWAGVSGGYFEYFLRRPTATIPYLPEPMQDALIRAIARDGVPQFIVADYDTKPTVVRLEQSGVVRRVGRAFANDVYEIVTPPAER